MTTIPYVVARMGPLLRLFFCCFLTTVVGGGTSISHKPLLMFSSTATAQEQQEGISGRVFVRDDVANPAVNARSPVSDAVVYLDSTDKIKLAPPTEPVRVEVLNGRLNPYHSCVIVGQQFIIEATDDGPYCFVVESPVEPRGGEILPPNLRRFEKVFKKPHFSGLIRCVINPKLIGYVSIVPNQVFARTAQDGSFRLDYPLAPGKYRLVAFHPEFGRAIGELEVSPDNRSRPVSIVLPISKAERDSEE